MLVTTFAHSNLVQAGDEPDSRSFTEKNCGSETRTNTAAAAGLLRANCKNAAQIFTQLSATQTSGDLSG